jgi:hypothetical protein
MREYRTFASAKNSPPIDPAISMRERYHGNGVVHATTVRALQRSANQFCDAAIAFRACSLAVARTDKYLMETTAPERPRRALSSRAAAGAPHHRENTFPWPPRRLCCVPRGWRPRR